MPEEFEANLLETLLPTYYRRLFPFTLMHQWLSYGDVNKTSFPNREFSFTLRDDVYIRFQSFANVEELQKEVIKKCPFKIDIGAIYQSNPKDHKKVLVFQPRERELVFDIDITDYDDVRDCCSGADICTKCWPLMNVAVKVLDTALRDDFGFNHILWVYSGRRGIHCWVCDSIARTLTHSQRSAVADYLTLVSGGQQQAKKVQLRDARIPPSVRRAFKILLPYFEDEHLRTHELMSTEPKRNHVIGLVSDAKMRREISDRVKLCKNDDDRWGLLSSTVDRHNRKSRFRNNSVEEIVLQYCYPRLDANVSKGFEHLLKAPFCVHPKTGRVCVPFDPRRVDKFDPFSVPTVQQLIEEIDQFDSKAKTATTTATNGSDDDDSSGSTNSSSKKTKDYKKTSLSSSVKVFKDFLAALEKERREKKIEINDEKMEF